MGRIEARTVVLKDGQTVCIRTPEVRDADKLVDYLGPLFVDDRYFLSTADEARAWQTPEQQRERIERFRQDDSKLLVISEVNARIVSISHIETPGRKRNAHVGQIGISILAEYRGLRLGTALMETMIDWAAAHPVIEKLALGVWARNEHAIRLYQKMGFVEEGRKIMEVRYDVGSYDDMVCMYRFVKQGLNNMFA